MVQVVRSIGAVANGGLLRTPHMVVKVGDEQTSWDDGDRAVSEDTAEKVADMMRTVVEEGTGYSSGVEGFDVAAKTGTGEHAENGEYMEGNYLLGDALLEKMKKSNSPSELEEQHHYIRLLELERQYFSGRLTESDLPSADTLLQYYDNSAFIDKNAISLLLEGYINISIQNYPTAIDFYLKAKLHLMYFIN
jgi:hypothetical protein